MLCDHPEGGDREGGRETQEGGDMGILDNSKSTECESSKANLQYLVQSSHFVDEEA